jgi:hypothetical protein
MGGENSITTGGDYWNTADNQFLIGDFSRAARLWARQRPRVEISTEHADFFVRTLVALLGKQRLALTVPRPDLLVLGELVPTL